MSDLTYQLNVILLLKKKKTQYDSRSYCSGSSCLEHHPSRDPHNHLSQHDIKFVGNNLHPINLLSLINTSTLPKE